MNGILSAIGTLVMVIAILVLTYFATRYIGKVGKFRGKAKYIRLVDQVYISQDKSIAIVKVGEHHMLVGIAANQISLLKEIKEEELIDFSIGEPSYEPMDFQAIFDKIRKRDGNK